MVEKEELENEKNELEEEEILKFAIALFSIMTIITVSIAVTVLNIDRDCDGGIIFNPDDCDCEDDYYNETGVIYREIVRWLICQIISDQ